MIARSGTAMVIQMLIRTLVRCQRSFEDWLDSRPLTEPAPRDAWALNLDALRSATSEGLRRAREDREVYTPPTVPRPPLRLVDIHGEPLSAREEPLQ